MIVSQNKTADFAIFIDYDTQGSPTKALRAFSNIIEAFERLDRDLVGSIDSKIKPITVLEDLEVGSIKGWLKNRLDTVDDDALKELNWKKAVGSYLVKAKYAVVNFLEDKTEITTREEVMGLEAELYRLAEETEVKRFPIYKPIETKKLIGNLKNISESVKVIENGQARFEYIAEHKEANFNMEIELSPDNLIDLITKEKLSSTQEMILKVKKPDYLGESMWELRFERKVITAKILDDDWLTSFQSREIDVRPGDSLRATVEVIVKYDYNMEVIGTDYLLHSVKEVIKDEPDTQLEIFNEDKGE